MPGSSPLVKVKSLELSNFALILERLLTSFVIQCRQKVTLLVSKEIACSVSICIFASCRCSLLVFLILFLLLIIFLCLLSLILLIIPNLLIYLKYAVFVLFKLLINTQKLLNALLILLWFVNIWNFNIKCQRTNLKNIFLLSFTMHLKLIEKVCFLTY